MRTSGWHTLVVGVGVFLGTSVGAFAQSAPAPSAAEELKQRVAVLAILPGGTVASGSTFGVVLWDARPVANPVTPGDDAPAPGGDAPGAPPLPSPPTWQVSARPGGVMLPDAVSGFALSGHTLAVAHGPAGISLLDVSDPTQLRTLSHLQLPGAALDVLADAGGVLWVALGTMGVACVDARDPAAPKLRGVVKTGGYVRHLIHHPANLDSPPKGGSPSDGGRATTRLLVAAGRAGLLEVTLGADLQLIQSRVLAQDADIKRLLPFGQGVIYSQGSKGLCYLPLPWHQGQKPSCLASKDVVRDMQAWGDRILVADGGAGVMVADFSSPSTPKSLGHVQSMKFTANRLMILDDLLFIAADASGVLALPLTALPTQPQSNPQ